MSEPSNSREIEVLFRYRDLILPTLEEHKKILDEYGKCWWGWWKRPTEQPREEIWDHLENELSKERVAVGLFDSGATNHDAAVHRVFVDKVKKPLHGARQSPKLPQNERKLVPEYYRKSPFSRAWMRIIAIEDEPLEFFGQYVYHNPPPLPNIPQQYLEAIRDKLVIDADELRAMDTTIWRVRPRPRRLAPHAKERFLAPGLRILDPVSAEPIKVSGSTILHISDVHFAKGKHREQHVWSYPTDPPQSNPMLADQITRAVEGKQVAIIVASGDFTFKAASEEFEESRHFVNTLLGSLGLGNDHLIVIPGNHDIAWTKPSTEKYDPQKEVTEAPTKATEEYRRFYQDLMRHEPNDDLSMGRRYVFPCGVLIDICALNSSSLETGESFLAGMGRVRPAAFDRVRSQLGWSEDAGSAALRLLTLHHHLTATEDVENPSEYAKGFGMAIDAKEILRDAARYGVHLALHGHRHRTFFWREGVYALPEDTMPKWQLGHVSLLGSGSAGSKEVSNDSHFFNLMTVESSGLEVEVFRSKKRGAFKRMTTWTAPFSFEDGWLRVQDWKHATP